MKHILTRTIRKLNYQLGPAVALLFAPLINLEAECTWRTLAQFESGLPAAVEALARDSAGNLYAAVSTTDPQMRSHAVVRKSVDQGASWTVIEDFESAPYGRAIFLSLGSDPAGHLYAAGYVTDNRGQTRWLVRRGRDGGSAWATMDEFTLPGGQMAMAKCLTVDSQGGLYVAGYGDKPIAADSPTRAQHWLVRQSRDGGQTWSTIDTYSRGLDTRAAAILSTSEGLLVAGSARGADREPSERWLVRKGVEDASGDFSWETVDAYAPQGLDDSGQGRLSDVHGLGQDAQGNLYAVGRSFSRADDGKNPHWIVRRSSNRGADWAVVDTFQLESGMFATARAVAVDWKGIYVVGQAIGKNLDSHWIVRRSDTGDAGSWSVCDDFQGLVTAASKSTPKAEAGADSSVTRTTSLKYPRGLAILVDGRTVLAGGMTTDDLHYAVVRALESTRASNLASMPVQ